MFEKAYRFFFGRIACTKKWMDLVSLVFLLFFVGKKNGANKMNRFDHLFFSSGRVGRLEKILLAFYMIWEFFFLIFLLPLVELLFFYFWRAHIFSILDLFLEQYAHYFKWTMTMVECADIFCPHACIRHIYGICNLLRVRFTDVVKLYWVIQSKFWSWS